jgi:hypothetical protein
MAARPAGRPRRVARNGRTEPRRPRPSSAPAPPPAPAEEDVHELDDPVEVRSRSLISTMPRGEPASLAGAHCEGRARAFGSRGATAGR